MHKECVLIFSEEKVDINPL